MPGPAATTHEHERHLAREALTMALYMAVVLLAVLIVLPDDDEAGLGVSAAIWGTATGLALAHWFAFRVAARLLGDGHVGAEDAQVATVQVLSALAVALVVTAPLLLLTDDDDVTIAVGELALIIGIVGYATARRAGAGRIRAVLAGVSTLLAGAVCVVVKALISH